MLRPELALREPEQELREPEQELLGPVPALRRLREPEQQEPELPVLVPLLREQELALALALAQRGQLPERALHPAFAAGLPLRRLCA